MENLMNKIEKFKDAERQRRIKWDLDNEEMQKEHKRKREVFDEFRSSHLKQATKNDYENWLRGWLVDHELSHYYDYEFPFNDFYVAKSDFVLDEGFYELYRL